MTEQTRRRMGTQLGRRRNRTETEQGWAESAEREANKLPEGHGQIVRDVDQAERVVTLKGPTKHVEPPASDVVPYRQINQPDPGAPTMHGKGTQLEAPTAPAHQVGAPPHKQGAHHPVGHSDPKAAQSEPTPVVYRIEASTTTPAGAKPVAAQQGFQSMAQQQSGGGVHKVGGQPVQPTSAGSMPASVVSVPGTINPDQAAQFLQQAQNGQQQHAGSQFVGGGPGQGQPQQGSQFVGGAGNAGVSAGVGAQPQNPGPQGPPAGSAEVLQESSVAVIAMADEETTRAELEAAGLTSRLRTHQTTMQRRVQPEELVPAERMDVTVILTSFGRPQLLRLQLDALRKGNKIPEMVCVLVIGDGPHPSDVLGDGRPWMPLDDGRPQPIPQNTYKIGATPWTRFQVAAGVTTKYVCILDDDCIPGPGWLEACFNAQERGLEAVIAAAGHRFGPEGSIAGYRGPWRGDDENLAVSDVDGNPDEAAVVDAGALGWFLPTNWMPSITQPGPAGNGPYGWQIHISSVVQYESQGQVPTVVLPYSTSNKDAWGATAPPEGGGLGTMEDMVDLRQQIFTAFHGDEEVPWTLVGELPGGVPLSIPIPEEPAPAPIARVDATAIADPQAAAPTELPVGSYWNAKLKRYVHTGEQEWNAEHYELMTGETWGQPTPESIGRVTETPQPATAPSTPTAPGTLARSERPQVGDKAAADVVPEPPKPVPAGIAPAIVEVDEGKHAWCSCGKSQKQPFCDGAHKDTPFEPLIFTLETKKKVHLCTCKATKNAPFCDGSHAKVQAAQVEAAAAEAEAESE